MSGPAVTIVEAGGIAVTAVESGAPLMTVVDSGGIAVTVVEAGGMPFVLENYEPGPTPDLPGNISDLTATAQSDTEILLEWTPADDATSHEYRIDGGSWIEADDNTGSQVVSGLTPETEYDFQVRGVNGDGNGAASNTATAETEATPWTVEGIVIEGDSITSDFPSQSDPAIRARFYSYIYADDPANASIDIEVRAEGSRVVGPIANLNDNGNSLIGNVAEDIAYDPDLMTAMIGDNDLGSNSAAYYQTNLTDYWGALKAAKAAVRFAWSPPLPYNPTGTPHPSYTYYTAQRAIVMSDARDPAVWGQWADYYLPMGEYPDFADPALAGPLFGDSVHPSDPGQDKLYESFKPAIDTIRDQTRASSTVPYESVWPADEDSLATSTVFVRRLIVSGIAHTGLDLGISVSGTGFRIRLNGGAWGTSIGRIYNGDIIDIEITTSSSADTDRTASLTIGSETRSITYRTALAVADVVYDHGDIVSVSPGGTTHTFSSLPFEAGLAVLFISATNGNSAVTVNGVAATQRFTQAASGVLEAWTCPVASAGSYNVVVTASSSRPGTVLSYGTAVGADATPTQASANAPGYDSPPFLTPSLTVPSHGLALIAFGEYGAALITPGTVNSPGTPIDEGHATFVGETFGVVLGSLAASGQGSFDYVFGSYARGGLVLKALGT